MNYDPMNIFFKNLKSDDINIRIETIKNIQTYAIALGPVRTRNEILKFISDIMQDEEQVIKILISKMPELIDYIGGKEYSSILLNSMIIFFQVNNYEYKDLIIENTLKIVNMNPVDNIPVVRNLIEELYETENDLSKIIAINLGNSLIENSVIEEDINSLTIFFIDSWPNELDIIRIEIYKVLFNNMNKIEKCLIDKKDILLKHFYSNFKFGSKYISCIWMLFFDDERTQEILIKIINNKLIEIKINFLKGLKHYLKKYKEISSEINFKNIIKIIKDNYDIKEVEDIIKFKNILLKVLLIIPKENFNEYFDELFKDDDKIYLINNFWNLIKIRPNKKDEYIAFILEILDKNMCIENISLFNMLYNFLENFDFNIIDDKNLYYKCLEVLISFKFEPKIRKKLFPLWWKYKSYYEVNLIKNFYFKMIIDHSFELRKSLIDEEEYIIYLFKNKYYIVELKDLFFTLNIKFKISIIDLFFNIFKISEDIDIKKIIFKIYMEIITLDSITNNLILKLLNTLINIKKYEIIEIYSIYDYEESINKLQLVFNNIDNLIVNICKDILWNLKKD